MAPVLSGAPKCSAAWSKQSQLAARVAQPHVTGLLEGQTRCTTHTTTAHATSMASLLYVGRSSQIRSTASRRCDTQPESSHNGQMACRLLSCLALACVAVQLVAAYPQLYTLQVWMYRWLTPAWKACKGGCLKTARAASATIKTSRATCGCGRLNRAPALASIACIFCTLAASGPSTRTHRLPQPGRSCLSHPSRPQGLHGAPVNDRCVGACHLGCSEAGVSSAGFT